ncbi:MAG TPA: transglycosylase domain-containing protein [Rhodopila sp.]|uniref:transglycosylase domain-containing protein n=1 Tax=Rhodopila sp. TaxID=2480087 RepID=UPI002C6817F2|nr:transglycosylase domain-containing protein [Rhodopila sp.]HVY16004.1 transglycosylase domain-containing protein [Rhodopila sp.]
MRPRPRWLVGAALLVGVGVYVHAVASRAHFESPAPTPIVYDRHGAFLAQFGDATPAGAVEYGFWPVEHLPRRVVSATLAVEDRRFWGHPGIDPRAVLRALWQDATAWRRRSGASTIAMQVARMQHPEARTLWAKAVEAGTAVALTARYGHAAVLAQYLRLVPYGNGSHGIGHAARWYFNKPAADLSWAEIALLCAVPRAPAAYNPLHPAGLRRARVHAGLILRRLRDESMMTGAEYQAATAQLAVLEPGPAPRRPAEALHPILRLKALLANAPPADTADDRVTATLDLRVQRMATALLRAHLASWRQDGAQQAALMVVQRGSNAVLAAVGSDAYGDPHGGSIDFTRAIRSPGSTLKPFLYAAALQRGLVHPADMLEDSPGQVGAIHNADSRYLGPLPPGQALANSRNVPAADVLRRLGLGAGFDLFRALGVQALEATPDSLGLAMAIGALPTSLDRLTDAYTALADDGVQHGLRWYRGQDEPPPKRVFPVAAAREVGLFLSDPLARLPSFARYGSTEYPFAVAVKTGTSQGYRDAWTVAWSGRFVVGAWVGRADAGTMARLGGANSAAALVRSVMLALHGTRPGDLLDVNFAQPDGYAPVPVCAGPDETETGRCDHTLLTWVPETERPTVRSPERARELPRELPGELPVGQAQWQPQGLPLGQSLGGQPTAPASPVPPDQPVRLSIVTPEAGTRVWRNPESPAEANRLLLRAKTSPRVPQIVWYVDGSPFALTDPGTPVAWPMQTGKHKFQIGLPLRPERSVPVVLTVQ